LRRDRRPLRFAPQFEVSTVCIQCCRICLHLRSRSYGVSVISRMPHSSGFASPRSMLLECDTEKFADGRIVSRTAWFYYAGSSASVSSRKVFSRSMIFCGRQRKNFINHLLGASATSSQSSSDHVAPHRYTANVCFSCTNASCKRLVDTRVLMRTLCPASTITAVPEQPRCGFGQTDRVPCYRQISRHFLQARLSISILNPTIRLDERLSLLSQVLNF
jgi:hypothetical protein